MGRNVSFPEGFFGLEVGGDFKVTGVLVPIKDAAELKGLGVVDGVADLKFLEVRVAVRINRERFVREIGGNGERGW